jgi:hypothetical protein
MTMGRLATPWFAIDAPYSWFAFAEPFAAGAFHIGTRFFHDYARQTGAKLSPSGPEAGLVPAFGRLESDSFHPLQVDPLIVEFYEHTAEFAMKVKGTFAPWLQGQGGAIYRRIAGRMEQLDVPDFAPGVAREMKSDFGFIETAQGHSSRIWIRTMKDDKSVFYVGAVHDSIATTEGASHSYLTMVFPLRRANLAVMLELDNLPDGGFCMTTSPERPSDAGTYLVRPGPTTVSWVALPGAKEEFTFRVRRTRSMQWIEGQHTAYGLGQKAFVLTYQIARSKDLEADSLADVDFSAPGFGGDGAEIGGEPFPVFSAGFKSIGALRGTRG